MSHAALFEDHLDTTEEIHYYHAGLPSYPRNFSRDTISAGIIAADAKLLQSQLTKSLLHQGKNNDSLTGEEPGKIHHEYPGVIFRWPFFSTYNACDTTALYLIGLEVLANLQTTPTNLLAEHQSGINAAVKYIKSHLKNNIFWEYPPSGGKHFSVRITYWKDSILPIVGGREEPEYPVAFALAHFQNARGVLAAANLLGSDELRTLAGDMFTQGIAKFITEQDFCVAEDSVGAVKLATSDEIHSLAYIPVEYAGELPIEAITKRAQALITKAGIACTPQNVGEKLTDTYHGYVVWIYEQAMLHYAANKFGLPGIGDVTERCVKHIGTGQELLTIVPSIAPRGNHHQLWSVAAKIYFSQALSLRQTNLL